MSTASQIHAVFDDSEVLTPTLGRRLFYGWCLLWAGLTTSAFATGYLLTHRFQPTVQHFKWWAGQWGRTTLWGFGLDVAHEAHTRLDPAQPYVFVANHQNSLDILAMGAALEVPFGFVAKAELARVPFLGWAIGYSPSVFIERTDPRRMIESMREAGERIRQGNAVLVYPEGARSYQRALLPFKRGAFLIAVEAGVPLVPVTIVNGYPYLDEQRRLARPGGIIRIVTGTPIPMDGATRRDIPAIIAEVRAQMEAELGPAGVERGTDGEAR